MMCLIFIITPEPCQPPVAGTAVVVSLLNARFAEPPQTAHDLREIPSMARSPVSSSLARRLLDYLRRRIGKI